MFGARFYICDCHLGFEKKQCTGLFKQKNESCFYYLFLPLMEEFTKCHVLANSGSSLFSGRINYESENEACEEIERAQKRIGKNYFWKPGKHIINLTKYLSDDRSTLVWFYKMPEKQKGTNYIDISAEFVNAYADYYTEIYEGAWDFFTPHKDKYDKIIEYASKILPDNYIYEVNFEGTYIIRPSGKLIK